MPALAWSRPKNSVSFKSSSRMRPLKLSQMPFCIGLPGANEVPGDAVLARPAEHRVGGELGAMVGDDHGRAAAAGDERGELACDPLARDRGIGDCQEALLLGVDEPAASIHSYLFSKLARFEMPRVFPAMQRHRLELIAYIQRYLEFASDAEQLDIMQAMIDWVKEKLPDR